MLNISQRQCEALAAAADSLFLEKMIFHFFATRPEWAASKGRETVREFILRGIEAAGRHEISLENDVAGFLVVLQQLGEDFDGRPEHAWATAALRGESSPSGKVEQLLAGLNSPKSR